MDGARFAHALSALGVTPAALSWRAGVTALALGATKNGALAAEAVVLFDRTRARELAYRRKRAGHLWSKQRFLAAQLLVYVEGDRWLKNAARANAHAARLGRGLERAGYRLLAPVETNQVLVQLPAAVAEALLAQGFQFYDWPALGPLAHRLVPRFDTPDRRRDRGPAALKSRERHAPQGHAARQASEVESLGARRCQLLDGLHRLPAVGKSRHARPAYAFDSSRGRRARALDVQRTDLGLGF